MAATIFGKAVDRRAQLAANLTKAVGTRALGAQYQDAIAGRIQTALTPIGRGMPDMIHDPTLGAPFASADNRLTVAQMGPGQPAENFPLGGEPRQMKYRVGWNFPTTPDSDRGITGDLLRTLSKSYFLLRRLIERRKSELCSFEWDIVPRERNVKRARDVVVKNADLIAQVRRFFSYPEAYYSLRGGDWVREGLVSWQDWLRASLEDVFVGDWLTLWPQMTYGGELLGLRRVDGAHIKPLLDLDGRIPPPPMPAFQFYLYGAPRASYAADELFYWPHNPTNTTPYGYSHVEQALMLLNMGIRFDMWNTAAFSESTIPMGLLETPEKITPEQIEDIASFLNDTIAGNLGERQRMHPVPNGTKWQAIKSQEFNNDFAMYLINLTCVAMDILPSEMGFAPSRAALGGAGWAQEQADQAQQNRVAFAFWVQGKMTEVIHRFWGAVGGMDLEFRFTDLVREDSMARWEANDKALRGGQMGLDEIIEAGGGDPIGFGRIIETKVGIILPEERLFISGKGILPLEAGAGVDVPPPGGPANPRPEGSPGAPAPVSTPSAKFGTESGLQPYDLGIPPQPPEDPDESAPVRETRKSARLEELGRWQRRALKDAKSGRNPGRAFSSDVLPSGWVEHIRYDLGHADTPDAVKAVFADHAKRADADDDEDDRERRKHEEEFVAAYLLLMRGKRERVASQRMTTADDVLRAFQMSRQDVALLRDQILALSRQSYLDAYNVALRQAGAQEVEGLPAGAEARLAEDADSAATIIAQTYDTALSALVDQLTTMTAGIDPDKRWDEVARDVAEWARKRSGWKSEQIAATEATKAAARGYADAVKTHHRMATLRWVAVLDSHTCQYCRENNGTIHPVSDWAFIPAHPGCRCNWVEADTGLPVSFFPSPTAAPGSALEDPGRADIIGG